MAGLMWSFLGIGMGISLIGNDQTLLGLTVVSVSAFAFSGVFTLSNLVIHYWRTPFANPAGGNAVKYRTGLVLGWLSMFAILFGKVEKSGLTEDGLKTGALLLFPNAVLVSIFWIVNSRRKLTRDQTLDSVEYPRQADATAPSPDS